MGEMILAFLNSTTTVYVLWALCLLSFLFFVGYAVSREGRDEHGRAILGSACFYGAIALFIAMNIFTQFTYTVTSNVIIFTNSIRLVFLAFFLLLDIMVVVFRKIRLQFRLQSVRGGCFAIFFF